MDLVGTSLPNLLVKDGEKNISVSLLQTLNTSFDNVSDLFVPSSGHDVNMDYNVNAYIFYITYSTLLFYDSGLANWFFTEQYLCITKFRDDHIFFFLYLETSHRSTLCQQGSIFDKEIICNNFQYQTIVIIYLYVIAWS